MACCAILLVVFWIIWLICDTYFLQTGINFDGQRIIPVDLHWYKVAKWLAGVFLGLSFCYLGGEISYIVYRSFAFKTDRNKVIYESIIHGAIALLILIGVAASTVMLCNNIWIGAPLYDQSGQLYDIEQYHSWYMMLVSTCALASVFSFVSLFQANKAFKIHNVYFDFCLMTTILAGLSIPLYIGSVCLIKIHPGIEYPAEFWLHIAGQGVYSAYQILQVFLSMFMVACLILLVRLNSEQLKRTKKNIILMSILIVINIASDIFGRIYIFNAAAIYNNENWIPQIIIISISFMIGIVSGWFSCYRYIELYAKPMRKLEKEPLILN